MQKSVTKKLLYLQILEYICSIFNHSKSSLRIHVNICIFFNLVANIVQFYSMISYPLGHGWSELILLENIIQAVFLSYFNFSSFTPEVLSGFRGFASSPPGFAAFWPQKAVKLKGNGRKNSDEEESGENDVKVDKVPKKRDQFAYIKMMRYEYDILMRDTTNMAPQQLAAHKWFCEKIKLKIGL